MLKSFLFHSDPLLKKIRKLAISLAALLFVLYCVNMAIVDGADPQFDGQQLSEIFGKFILGAIIVACVCQMLRLIIKVGPIKIEATIVVEGKKLSEKQSMAVRMALKHYCEDHQVDSYDEKPAAEVLKIINQDS
jgi:hypothetical protein